MLAEALRGGAALQQQVLALLEAAETSDSTLTCVLLQGASRMLQALLKDTDHGGRPYRAARRSWRIERRLGRGGLATVYRAHRDDGAFDQTVALKVLRRGLDTDDVDRPIRAERQILSALNHPAITQILDGGAWTTAVRISFSIRRWPEDHEVLPGPAMASAGVILLIEVLRRCTIHT